jgi:hypothetical protein
MSATSAKDDVVDCVAAFCASTDDALARGKPEEVPDESLQRGDRDLRYHARGGPQFLRPADVVPPRAERMTAARKEHDASVNGVKR